MKRDSIMKHRDKLALVLVIILICIFLVYKVNKVHENSYLNETSGNVSEVYTNYLDDQSQKYNEYLSTAQQEIQRANQINEINIEHQMRYEDLLIRWEQQADRIDSIIEKMENNL